MDSSTRKTVHSEILRTASTASLLGIYTISGKTLQISLAISKVLFYKQGVQVFSVNLHLLLKHKHLVLRSDQQQFT